MEPEFFEKVLTTTLDKIKNVLSTKSSEYVRNNNKMHNFEVGAKLSNQSREKVLQGFALKHYVSICDIREDLEIGKLPSIEKLDEKYIDFINYLILEKAAILERILENNNNKKFL